MGKKLICEVSSSFSIPWPTNQSLCCVDLSVGFIICLLKKESSPAEAESLHWARPEQDPYDLIRSYGKYSSSAGVMSAGDTECQSQQCPWRQRPWTSTTTQQEQGTLPPPCWGGFRIRMLHHHSKVMGLPHGVRLGKGEAGTRHPCPSQQEVSAKVQWDPELSMLLSNNKETLTSWVWTKTNPRPGDHNLDPHFTSQ